MYDSGIQTSKLKLILVEKFVGSVNKPKKRRETGYDRQRIVTHLAW